MQQIEELKIVKEVFEADHYKLISEHDRVMKLQEDEI